MPNIMNHAMDVGHLSLEERPFDELDALVLSQLVYLPLKGFMGREDTCTIEQAWEYICEHAVPDPLDAFQKKRYQLFEVCAELPRYAYWNVCDYVDEIDQEREMQFCACAYDLHNGCRCLAFRGTDMSLVGWKEDFNLSFTTVPSQHEAAEYAQRVSMDHGDVLYFCGHSKGGNLAVYAAAATDASTRERIRRVYSFDAPGVDEGTLNSPGYALVSERIDSYLPQSSIVGMLLNYHPVYTVVRANTIGVLQHDTMTWQVRDGAFVELEGVDHTAKITDETIHAWLAGIEPEERRQLVDTLYDVVEASRAQLVTELVADWKESANRMLEAFRDLSPAFKKNVRRILRSLFATGANEVVSTILETLTHRERDEEE